MSTLVPDENSMKDPLCMVSLDYVTPDTTEDGEATNEGEQCHLPRGPCGNFEQVRCYSLLGLLFFGFLPFSWSRIGPKLVTFRLFLGPSFLGEPLPAPLTFKNVEHPEP